MSMKYGWHRENKEPIECNTCGAKPCVNPRFCRLCRIADKRRAKLMNDDTKRQQDPAP